MSVFDMNDDEDWRFSAACAGKDLDMFFPGKAESGAEAIAVCRDCPVRTRCLEEYMMEPRGIFGGLSAKHRQQLRVKTGRSKTPVRTAPPTPLRERPPCGTTAGYDRHQRLKEPSCQPCRDAKNDYRRKYKAAKKAAA